MSIFRGNRILKCSRSLILYTYPVLINLTWCITRVSLHVVKTDMERPLSCYFLFGRFGPKTVEQSQLWYRVGFKNKSHLEHNICFFLCQSRSLVYSRSVLVQKVLNTSGNVLFCFFKNQLHRWNVCVFSAKIYCSSSNQKHINLLPAALSDSFCEVNGSCKSVVSSWIHCFFNYSFFDYWQIVPTWSSKREKNFNPNSFLPSRWSLCVYQQAEKSKPIGTNVHRSRRRLTVGSIFRRVSILSKDFFAFLPTFWKLVNVSNWGLFWCQCSCLCLSFLPIFHKILIFQVISMKVSVSGEQRESVLLGLGFNQVEDSSQRINFTVNSKKTLVLLVSSSCLIELWPFRSLTICGKTENWRISILLPNLIPKQYVTFKFWYEVTFWSFVVLNKFFAFVKALIKSSYQIESFKSKHCSSLLTTFKFENYMFEAVSRAREVWMLLFRRMWPKNRWSETHEQSIGTLLSDSLSCWNQSRLLVLLVRFGIFFSVSTGYRKVFSIV